jgi:hypothetical protein
MNQAKNGVQLTGILAGTAVVCATLLCGCSQTRSTAGSRAGVESSAENANMQEVVITASRQSTPPKG